MDTSDFFSFFIILLQMFRRSSGEAEIELCYRDDCLAGLAARLKEKKKTRKFNLRQMGEEKKSGTILVQILEK